MAPTLANELLSNTEFLKPFAVVLTRDAEAAKDLYQETVYRALINKDKYKVGTNVKAWLCTIMRNVFINNYRRRGKQQAIFNNQSHDIFLNSSKASILNAALVNLNCKDLNKAVYNLPEIFKAPFLLHFEGFKYHEIAELLSEPLGTIKSRIHFARKLLKEQVEKF